MIGYTYWNLNCDDFLQLYKNNYYTIRCVLDKEYINTKSWISLLNYVSKNTDATLYKADLTIEGESINAFVINSLFDEPIKDSVLHHIVELLRKNEEMFGDKLNVSLSVEIK